MKNTVYATLPQLSHELLKDRGTILRRVESGDLVPDATAGIGGRMLLFELARLPQIKALFDSAGRASLTKS